LNKSQLLILMIPVVLFSLTAHEYSHGRIAFLLGDNTAQRLGRLSFNPLKHLDPTETHKIKKQGAYWVQMFKRIKREATQTLRRIVT
jgi:Zn-dependent protease